MIHNPILQTSLDFLHLMATIAWIGGMFFNFLVVMPTVAKVLDPATAGRFVGALMKRVRVVVYVSLLILFVTGIPMKIANENYVAIISFENAWQIAGFIKHVFVGLMAVLAFYSFEILTPSVVKLSAQGPSPAITTLRKRQMMIAAATTFLFGIIVIFLSAVMKYL
ncbi:MAG: DUF4149 domain-containing protein [Bacteroidales bacterium]|nr:DUF4149 domain-containing protein [Bacteroidales bacterium]